MKILVPLDGSESSKRAAAFLASRSSLIGAEPEVHLLNVQQALAPYVAAELGREVARRISKSEAEGVLEPAREALAKAGIDAKVHVDAGHAAETIVQATDRLRADLIVIGARGYSEFRGLLFGPVATGC